MESHDKEPEGVPKTSPWSEPIKPFAEKKTARPPTHAWRGRLVFILATAAIVLGATYYLYKPQGPNVGLQFTKPDHVFLGDPFVLTISASNYSDSVLRNARISLFLPDGVSFEGQSEGQRVSEQTVGDPGPGSINQLNFNLIVTQGGESLKHVSAKLSYGTAQNSSVYENLADVDILIGQPAISINLFVPQNILNGQDFDVKVNYTNNSGHDFKNLRLKVDYPAVFQFKRSTMESENNGNNSWFLGTLSAGSQGTISITGNIVGQEKSSYGFSARLTATFLGETYTINNQPIQLFISPSPLAISLKLNNVSDYVANPGDTLKYILTYTNNSDVVMQNLTVRAKLTGELFDFQSLAPDVPFNSLTNSIAWFVGNTPQLMNLGPGQGGSIEFSIRLKDVYPIRLLSDKNFTLKVDAQAESPTIPPNTSANRTISITNITNKVAGKLGVVAEAYWRDAASGILNKGPYPPKVNQPTQYTIHWRIKNYATDMTNIMVSGYIQSGVRYTGTVKSNVSTSPTYDPNSGLVIWQIPSLPATKGVVGPAAETIFQVEATPALNQALRHMPLLSETKIQSTDSFVGALLQLTVPSLDTSLPADKATNVGDRNVQP